MSFFSLVTELETLLEQLNMILTGASDQTVEVNGVTKDSISKAIEDRFTAIQAIINGNLVYETKALMDAAGAPPAGELAKVWNDPTTNNNGLYGYKSNAWIKSEYDKVKSGSITRELLNNIFLSLPQLVGDENISSFTKDGFTYCASNHTVAGLPNDFPSGSPFILFNADLIDGAGRFKLQRLIQWNDFSKTWERKLDTQLETGDWHNKFTIKVEQLSSVKLSRAHLSNSFAANGILASNSNLDEVIKDGVWWLSPSGNHAGYPEGWASQWTGLLFTSDTTATGRFIHQVLIRYGYPKQRWERTIDTQSSEPKGWDEINASIERSKLTNNFLSFGGMARGNVNLLTKDGTYTLIKGENWVGLPDTDSSLILFNTMSESDWLHQKLISIKNSHEQWSRVIRTSDDPSTYPDFYKAESNSLYNRFKSLKIAYIGDSIVEQGTIPEQIANQLGATVYKMGFGGCRMAMHHNVLYNTMSMCEISGNIRSGNYSSLIQGAEDLFSDNGDDNRPQAALVRDTDWQKIDCLIIAFGTNDYAANIPIGAQSDFGTETYYGAINKVVDDILSVNPKTNIVFLSPVFRSRIVNGDGKNSDDFPNDNGVYLSSFADTVISSAKRHKVLFKDLHRESAINKYTASTYLRDGVHPNSDGDTLLANKISAFIMANF